MANESNKFEWKSGYCPLCKHVVTLYTDQFWTNCPNCRHHLSLNINTTIEYEDVDSVDVVEVVRCKDCKNWDQKQCADGYGWCDKVSAFKLGEWYCADGVNKNV